MAKRIVKAKINVFTMSAKDLHKLGIPEFNRKTVKAFLEDKGAKLAISPDEIVKSVGEYNNPTSQQLSLLNKPSQMELRFEKNSKESDP